MSSPEPPTLEWTSDNEFVLAGVSYLCLALPTARSTADRFCIIKPRWQVERYERLLDEANPKNIFELGIWEGGSTALIAQLAQPNKLVAVDLNDKSSAALESFLDTHGYRDTISTYYGVDQADAARISEIVEREFRDEPLDLVIDDASHLLDQTRRSFNLLFPRVAPGGMYLIEDWSWAHNDFPAISKGHLHGAAPLSILVFELILACAHHPTVIQEIVIKKGLAMVRRGPEPIDPASFDVSASYGAVGRELLLGLDTH